MPRLPPTAAAAELLSAQVGQLAQHANQACRNCRGGIWCRGPGGQFFTSRTCICIFLNLASRHDDDQCIAGDCASLLFVELNRRCGPKLCVANLRLLVYSCAYAWNNALKSGMASVPEMASLDTLTSSS